MTHNEPHHRIVDLIIDQTTAAKIAEINRNYDTPTGKIKGDAMGCVRFVSSVLSMNEKEILVTRWIEILNVLGAVNDIFYNGYMSCMAYNGGAGSTHWIGDPEDGPLARAKEHREAQAMVKVLKEKGFLKAKKTGYESALGLIYSALERHKGETLGELLNEVLHGGSGWFSEQDISTSKSFSFDATKDDNLLLGVLGDYALWYQGEKSLVTIAAPGSGKTQCHVLPALKYFQGSAIVLDIKGECFDETANLRIGDVFNILPLRIPDKPPLQPARFCLP
ncbi:type IV secretory system conjugative DNA transfer family protein [Shimia sp. R11_0]|uniref:type IV secretory system conjugative DNA transfer family protein n=1 Tax=Shimia sp. R11_0 TaxID=2821096 RepID=UPI001ADBB480|nr:type IV secretory system conjugative DNA transfer family protein [Shimia sp. R11_0]MBO9479748.1 type IV secretory system conjugative DNA transfer family protein [Shimia sp. R11_0]